MNLTELELAQRIRDGTVPSPVKFSNMWLVNLRITGTGLAYRTGLDEHVWRDPKLYLNEEFLARCNGLPVIENHPDEAVLTEEDYKSRSVGSVMLPYIRGDEVWAVCRIYIKEIVEKITKGKVSTSPSVVFNNESGNVEVMDGDTNFLIEGTPFLIDHIALVTEDHGSLGVWDKDRLPAGVDISNNTGDIEMDEKLLQSIIAQAVGDALGGVSKKIDSFSARMDSLENGIKARADADEKNKEEKEKADAEEKAKADAAEKERADAEDAEAKAKADAEAEEKAKADAAEAEEKAKADAEENAKSDTDMTDARVKADSAYTACGKQAPSPFSGEKALDYRKRVLLGMQKHSEKHKEVNIRAIADSATLSVLEEAIYGEARKSIENEMNNTLGQLHKRVRMDEAGRRITEYQGDPNVWLAAFKTPGRRLAKINTQGSQNHG